MSFRYVLKVHPDDRQSWKNMTGPWAACIHVDGTPVTGLQSSAFDTVVRGLIGDPQ